MGYLNPTEDDDYRIAAMPGTNEVPAAGALEGLGSAIVKGIASADAKLYDVGNDFLRSDLGQTLSLFTPATAALRFSLPEAGSKEAERANVAAKVVADWGATGQDPRKTGAIGRTIAGTSEGLTIATAGTLAAGPWGAAGLLGATEGYSVYKDAVKQGLGEDIGKQQAAVTGLLSAASVFIPMKFGSSLLTNVAGGSVTNLATGMLQRGLTSKVLEDNGRPDMATQYRVFDGEAMAADAILGSAFGVMGHYMAPQGRVPQPEIDAASAVAAEEHFNRSGMGVPTDPQTATLHADTMAAAMRALTEGDEPNIAPETAQTLADNVLPDPIHEFAPAIDAAAKEDLPHYEAAVADVPRVELLAEKIPEPKPEVVPKEGEAKPVDVPLDDYHAEQLDHLVLNHGDLPYVTEDGREITIRDLANELQKQRNEAESFGVMHELATACFARNGV